MSRLYREQIFGSVTTAEQNEKQNETFYNWESVLFYSANNENMFFFSNLFLSPKQIKWDYYYSIKKAARSNELSG